MRSCEQHAGAVVIYSNGRCPCCVLEEMRVENNCSIHNLTMKIQQASPLTKVILSNKISRMKDEFDAQFLNILDMLK